MDLKRIDAAIEAYAGSAGEDTMRRLEFFRGIWGVLDRYERELAGVAAARTLPSADELDAWYWDEQPMLAHVPVSVSADVLLACVRDLTTWVAESGRFDQASVLELSSYDWGGITTPGCLELAGSDPASLLEIAHVRSKSDMVMMVLSLALRAMIEPTQETIMAALHDRIVEENRYHKKPQLCPVCGGQAAAAYVGPTASSAGNGRRLYCGQCGATWEFERIRCPRCGSTEQGHLHYFSVAGDDDHRLYACDDCGGYIRTRFVSDDSTTAAVPEVEDVVMTTLDAVAQSGALAGRTPAGE